MPGWGGGDLLYEVTGMLSGKLNQTLGESMWVWLKLKLTLKETILKQTSK